MPEKYEKQLECMESVQWVERWKIYGGKDLWKRWVLSLEWKRKVMDGDSCDEGNHELTCVRSDESDKYSWSVGSWSSMGSWFQRQSNAWRKERLL